MKCKRLYCGFSWVAWFQRFSRRERMTDAMLLSAVMRAEQGLIDADLGGGVIKQRIARESQGKSGGYRSIILFLCGDKAFFIYGFAKSERDNISNDELADFKKAALEYLALSDEQIQQLIDIKALGEVKQ
ncbi:type II toxin-antitoxin system RelE/ParE family toxin [Moorena sp. SIOASIH]|uniref:type II toxin-antitoxin system RelE/ParE family toxin n=1 Tax=Moorena sp. SIOASIH TaxID=2607817 RepID=UPI0025E8C649|nr:type II toxin-antitoxin system RelE/ParE family toxin [Moorena sp. SIOASIH]